MHEAGALGRALVAAFATAPPGAVASRRAADLPFHTVVRPVTRAFRGVEIEFAS